MLRRAKSNRDIFDAKTGGRAGSGSSREAGRPALARQPSSSILIGGGASAVGSGEGRSGGTAASTIEHFLSGLVIHLVRRGIGRVQYDVLCQRIKEKGTFITFIVISIFIFFFDFINLI